MRTDTPGASGGRDAVVEDAGGAPHEIVAVVGTGDRERLAQPGRPGEQVAVAPGLHPPFPHELDAVDRRGGAQQHRGGVAGLGRDDVGAPVHAVGEVHVEVPGRPEHHLGARRHAPVRVAAGVVGPEVRLDLDDARRQPTPVVGPAHEQLVEQVGREHASVTRVERTWQRAPAAHPGSCSQRACSASRTPRLDHLLLDRRRTGATGGGAPQDRRARLEQRERFGTEVGLGEHQLVEGYAALGRVAHQRPDPRVGVAEGHALLHQPLGEVDRGGVLAVGRRLHACCHHLRRREQPGDRAQREPALVERVEQRLLVLLEVAVVGEREALERGQEPGEVADQAAGLAARELGDVGVLLLRQHRRPGAVRVGEAEEAELLAAPQHDLLAQTRQVHLGERGDEQRLGHEVAVGHRVERVVEPAGEAEVGGGGVGIEREARPRERAGAERRDVGPGERVAPALDVAAEGPEVGEEVVREQHRLRALEVRVAGEVDVVGGIRARHEHLLQPVHVGGDVGALAPEEQAQRGGDLVVAAATGVELRPRGPRQLGDPALDGGVDVLVGRRELERAVEQLGPDAVERGDDLGRLVVGEHPRARQARDVRAGTREVVGREAPVERQALGERQELLGRALGEPAVPEGHVLGPAGCREPPCWRAHVSTESPHRRTKPAESSWRNVSDAS